MKKILYTVWDCIYPIIIYVFINIFAFAMSAYMEANSNKGRYIQLIDFGNELVINLIAAVMLIFIWLFIINISKSEDKKIPVRLSALSSTEFRDYIFIGWLGISLGMCLNVIISIFGITEQDEVFKQVSELIENQPFWLKALSAGIVIPIQEELMYRGVIYKNIEKNYDNIRAAIISSLAFAVMHMNLSQGIYAFLMGLVLAYIYNKTQNIYTCMVFHCSANLFVLLISTSTVTSFLEENIYLVPVVLLCMLASAYIIMLYLHKEYRRNI